MALPTGVVFDLDDTLHDTAGIEAETLLTLWAAVREQWPHADEAAFRARYRDGRDELYQRVLSGEWDIPTYRRAHLSAACEPWGEPSEALQATQLRLRDEQLQRARFLEHATEILAELRAAGVRTALLTNGPSAMQRHKVQALGLEAQLDAIAISGELGVAKPDPAAFAAALELIDCQASEAVMVGDHLDWDVRGALDAGLRGAVWVAGDDDREPPPRAVRVTRLREVPAALASLV